VVCPDMMKQSQRRRWRKEMKEKRERRRGRRAWDE
jgi:hypothetical protein